ncbi:MAG: 23S rRNA (uracil(1939)-C(5))-methyltransferase RlmD [Cyanobacteria bacterium P01_H01_bin.121]
MTTDAISLWQQGQLLELDITDLSDRGDGVGHYDGRAVFVPDTAPGDRAQVRLVRVKPTYGFGQLQTLQTPSLHRTQPHCIVADKCGGCQWQHLDYAQQQVAKRQQIIEALQRIGSFTDPPVQPLLPTEQALGYRNKATYPLGQSTTGQVQAGYYRKGSHRLINLNQCPVQDPHLDPLLAGVKQDLQAQGWSIYDERTQRGCLRHLSLRIGRRSGEKLLTLVTTDWDLPGIDAQAQQWLQAYPGLVGISLNRNRDRTNRIFGSETRCIAGQPYLTEQFAGLTVQIRPQTFFQIYTEQAEALVNYLLDYLQLRGDEQIVDAYCGIGTLTLPLAQHCRQILGLEVQAASVTQAQQNAQLNGIGNAQFQVGPVARLLTTLPFQPDIMVLDPPRKGCDAAMLTTLRAIAPARLIYMSCKPSTLARDLKVLCHEGQYQLTHVQPADFFPQTPHVECLAFLNHT